jgi:hypothetical protein
MHKQWILHKSFYNVSMKTVCIPWLDSNPGLLVPEADAMSTAPRSQGQLSIVTSRDCGITTCNDSSQSPFVHCFLLYNDKNKGAAYAEKHFYTFLHMHIIIAHFFVTNTKLMKTTLYLSKALCLWDQGSMLWSQFSAIFVNFRRKNWRFSQKPMLWSKFCII